MMFLGMFRGGLQKMVKKGSKFVPPGPKKTSNFPLFWPFSQFLDLKIIPVNEFF